MSSSLWPLQTFDSSAEVHVVVRGLPHWSQAGCLCFLTWRTIDSLPRSVVAQWYADRAIWLSQHGIVGKRESWNDQLAKLPPSKKIEFRKRFSHEWHQHLDRCHGSCVLRNPDNARDVADSLFKYDGDRYQLTDFVIMPNHIHLVAAFVDESGMLGQCDSWKHFTARKINLRLSRRGKFWQSDGFDHLIRTTEQFEAIRKYIATNPEKARLKEGDFLHYSKDLTNPA